VFIHDSYLRIKLHLRQQYQVGLRLRTPCVTLPVPNDHFGSGTARGAATKNRVNNAAATVLSQCILRIWNGKAEIWRHSWSRFQWSLCKSFTMVLLQRRPSLQTGKRTCRRPRIGLRIPRLMTDRWDKANLSVILKTTPAGIGVSRKHDGD
jgi:hypothetical protein